MKNRVNFKSLERVSGGTPEEAYEYLYQLKEKYKVASVDELNDLATSEETAHLLKLTGLW